MIQPLPRTVARALRWAVLGALCALWSVCIALAPAHAADSDSALDMARQRVDAVQKAVSNPEVDIDPTALCTDTVAIAAEAEQAASRVQPQLTSAQARLDQLGASSTGEARGIATLRATLERSRNAWLTQLRLANLLSLESAQLLLRIEALRRAHAQASLGIRHRHLLLAD